MTEQPVTEQLLEVTITILRGADNQYTSIPPTHLLVAKLIQSVIGSMNAFDESITYEATDVDAFLAEYQIYWNHYDAPESPILKTALTQLAINPVSDNIQTFCTLLTRLSPDEKSDVNNSWFT